MIKSYLPSYEKLLSRRHWNNLVFAAPLLVYLFLDSDNLNFGYLAILAALAILSMSIFDLIIYVARIKDIMEK